MRYVPARSMGVPSPPDSFLSPLGLVLICLDLRLGGVHLRELVKYAEVKSLVDLVLEKLAKLWEFLFSFRIPI